MSQALATWREALRASPTLLKVGFSGAVAYRAEFLVWILTTNTPLVMLLLWSAVAEEAPVGAFGQAEFGAYFLAALVVRLLTGNWVVWELTYEIRQGTLAQKLLRPIHPLYYYATEGLAALPLRAAISLPIAILAWWWVGSGQLAADPLLWLLLPLALAGAWWMTFFVMAAIGSLGLLWESSVSLFNLWLGLFFIFSGYILPLALFPDWLWAVVQWLPFRYMLSFPVEVMLGMVQRQELLGLFLVQGAWLLFFWLLTRWVWGRGVRRYAAFGG